ncbi:hypothetical protein GGS24DRAFT_500805 [Hypoxylon argillaceum]|nr:hypothetical protein GGS24DRAFT_500805 [Hypoxylon argillaceum]KAI1150118.1 hypothetical protein F4825DRAFT_463630 [Nemania diffusa]
MYIPGIIYARSNVSPGPRSEGPGAEQHPQVFPASDSPNDWTPDINHRHPLAWLIISPSAPSSGSLGKRSTNPNTTTSVVAGILVTAFIIFAGIFLYVYRRSIRFRQQARSKRRRHRHRRRASGVSKNSQASDAAAGGGGDGGGDGGDTAADAGAQA